MRFFKEVLWITKTPDLHWVCLHFVHGHSGASEAFPRENHRPWNICDIQLPEEKSSWLVLHTSPRHLRQRRSIAKFLCCFLIHSVEKSFKVSQDFLLGTKNSKARQLPTQIHAYIYIYIVRKRRNNILIYSIYTYKYLYLWYVFTYIYIYTWWVAKDKSRIPGISTIVSLFTKDHSCQCWTTNTSINQLRESNF